MGFPQFFININININLVLFPRSGTMYRTVEAKENKYHLLTERSLQGNLRPRLRSEISL